LVELEIINKWLGGNAVTLSGLNALLKSTPREKLQTLRIADLGCGGGDMLKILSGSFKRKKIDAAFTGIDANPNIIAYAIVNSIDYLDISYQTLDIFSSEFRSEQYDIVFATLFFHHFTEDQLVEIFSSLKEQTKIGIVINDLHRHWLAYYSIKLLTTLFSKSPMVKNDAPLSVHRGFKKNELIKTLEKAGIKNYSLKWMWAFRWQLIIYAGGNSS
jgi:2-polyprenyl-3-methyl-5-hydroxy-6-metoxy-1,4-benzoquinol methylase